MSYTVVWPAKNRRRPHLSGKLLPNNRQCRGHVISLLLLPSQLPGSCRCCGRRRQPQALRQLAAVGERCLQRQGVLGAGPTIRRQLGLGIAEEKDLVRGGFSVWGTHAFHAKP